MSGKITQLPVENGNAQELSPEQVKEIVQSRKRGSKSASIEATTTATPNDISRIIKENLYWYNREIVKSDEECAERLNEFFQRMQETGEIPTVEKMCLALGTTRTTVYKWENGVGATSARINMIKKAKEILAAMDAQLVSENKIPQVTYIFRAKNFFGMSDKTEVVVTPNAPYEAAPEPERAKKYLDGVVDEEE